MRACLEQYRMTPGMSAGGPQDAALPPRQGTRSSLAMVGMHALDHRHTMNPHTEAPRAPRHSHTGCEQQASPSIKTVGTVVMSSTSLSNLIYGHLQDEGPM